MNYRENKDSSFRLYGLNLSEWKQSQIKKVWFKFVLNQIKNKTRTSVLGDVVWLPMTWSSNKCQATNTAPHVPSFGHSWLIFKLISNSYFRFWYWKYHVEYLDEHCLSVMWISIYDYFAVLLDINLDVQFLTVLKQLNG